MRLPRTSPGGDDRRGTRQHLATSVVDHDQAAATGRSRRSIVDIDRVVALAAAQGDDPDWNEVTVALEHLRASLSHDLASVGRPPMANGSGLQSPPRSVPARATSP